MPGNAVRRMLCSCAVTAGLSVPAATTCPRGTLIPRGHDHATSRASLLTLLASPGWDAYINVSMVAAVFWIAAWVIARRAVRRTRLRYSVTTIPRGLGAALVLADLFNLAIEAATGQWTDAGISAVGAFLVGLALSLPDGDHWFTDFWKKARRKARAIIRRARPQPRPLPHT